MASLTNLPPENIPPIYTGVWINWSRGRVYGSTLTLLPRYGALLTAFVALFVAYTSSLLWRVICFAFHQGLSSRGKPRKALYHQRQATLRNSDSAAAACWRFINIVWAWRHQQTRLMQKLLPLTIFCLLYWALVTTASVFSSTISNIVGDEVLISSPYCGTNGLAGYYEPGEPAVPLTNGISILRRIVSLDYARSCYVTKDPGAACNTFIKAWLPTTIDWNATCPFDLKVCKSAHDNFRVEARVNTHEDLGINGPWSESLDLLWTSQCAPLKTDGYKTYLGNQSSFAIYHYGTSTQLRKEDQTFKVKRRNATEFLEQRNLVQTSYALSTYTYSQRENGSQTMDTTFTPIDELRDDTADIDLHVLTGDFAQYTAAVDDPWYSAHTFLLSRPTTKSNLTIYLADEEASPLACKTQIQVCSPDGPCTEPENLINAYDKRTKQNTPESKLLLHLFQIFAAHSIMDIPEWQQVGSLQLGSGGIVSGGLRPDQWKFDVSFWTSQFLAALQGSMIDAAVGTSGSALTMTGEWILANMTDPTAAGYCHNQKIRSPGHVNFSVLWLSVICGLGGFFMILEWSLEPLATWIEHRRTGPNYALVEWQTQGFLQLQRLAHEELGLGPWERGSQTVPILRPEQKLADVDVQDRRHPRLKVPTGTATVTVSTHAQKTSNAKSIVTTTTSLSPPTSTASQTTSETNPASKQNIPSPSLSSVSRNPSGSNQVPVAATKQIQPSNPASAP